MRRWIFLIVLAPLLYGCIHIYQPNELVYEFPDKFYTARVYYVKIGLKNTLGFLISGITVKVNGTEYRTDDSGYATIELYYEESGTKQMQIECESFKKTIQIKVEKPSWLIFLWLASDNNLDRYTDNDLKEITSASEDVSVVILWDSSDQSRDGVYFLTNSSGIVLREKTGEINSGDGNLLNLYTNRFSKVESDHKALIIWDHGLGWVDVVPKNYVVKGISYDDESKDFLTIEEIANNVKGRWDVLGMDACLMGSLEVVYALRGCADYVVASAHEIKGTGWDYRFLESVSRTTPFEFCKQIVDYYKEFYKDDHNTSLAVYGVDEISNAVDSLNSFLSQNSVDFQSRSWTVYNSTYDLYDLGEVLESLQATETWEKFDEVVVYRYLSGAKPKSLATSIFVCADKTKIELLNYVTTAFAVDTVWDEFLLSQ